MEDCRDAETRLALPASTTQSGPAAAPVPSSPTAPGAAQKALLVVANAAYIEMPDQAGGKLSGSPGSAPSPSPSAVGASQDNPDNGDEMVSNLAGMEAPYFQPYWSAAFFATGIGAILMIFAFCWLYVGAFWNPTTRLSNLHVMVLDCDELPPASSLNPSFAPLLPQLAPVPLASGLLGATVWNQSSPLSRVLYWERGSCPGAGPAGRCGSPVQEAECLAALSDDVRQGGPWVLLYFPSTFTASYLSWYPGSGVAPQYQPPMGQYVYARGRDYSTYNYLAAVVLTGLLPGLSRSFTAGLAANPAVVDLISPAFLATGISVQEVDMAPVKNFGQHFASYVFCVLLWLGSSFVVVSSYQFKLPIEAAALDPRSSRGPATATTTTTTTTTTTGKRSVPGFGCCGGSSGAGAGAGGDAEAAGGEAGAGDTSGRMVRLSHLAWALMVKALVAAVFMFALMVLLCVVLWAVGGGNEQWYYNPGYAMAFGWYMSWSFISINAVLLHVIGIERFSSMTALLLILQLTSASGILSLDLSNRFFYIGQGLPFFYGVRGFRTIFFGTLENKMYINWLVLTAYNVVFAPLGLLMVAHRVWTAPDRARRQHQRGENAAGMGGVVLPVAAGFA